MIKENSCMQTWTHKVPKMVMVVVEVKEDVSTDEEEDANGFIIKEAEVMVKEETNPR